MLPVKAPTGRPDSLVCTHTATGHNNAVLSLAVTEDLLITGSKGKIMVFYSNIITNALDMEVGEFLLEDTSIKNYQKY